jgi:hypothetical protein
MIMSVIAFALEKGSITLVLPGMPCRQFDALIILYFG